MNKIPGAQEKFRKSFGEIVELEENTKINSRKIPELKNKSLEKF